MVILGEMDPEVTELVILAQIWTCRPLIRPIIHQQGMVVDPEFSKSPHKLVQPGNVSIRAFYMVILGKVDLQVAKLVNMAHIWTYRLLKRPLICQWDVLEGPKSLKSLYKLVLLDNVSISSFYWSFYVSILVICIYSLQIYSI